MKIIRDYISGKIYSQKRYKELNKLIHKLRQKRNYLIFDLNLNIEDKQVLNIEDFIIKLMSRKIYLNTYNKFNTKYDDTNYMM